MELNVNGTRVADPAAADIVGALGEKSFPQGWRLVLDSGTGALLDARAQPDGSFTLAHVDNQRRRNAATAINAATLSSILLKFLKGDPKWERECRWQVEAKPQPASKPAPAKMRFVPAANVTLTGDSGREPSPWAVAAIVGVIGFVILIFTLVQWLGPGVIPYSNSDYFYIGLIFLPMVALVVVASVSKLIEYRQARSWAQTTGTVVRSEIEARHHRFQDEPETIKNVPAVEYEFSAGGRKVRSSRIGIGADAGADIEATLARYPLGAGVTVYYDAANPAHCVLERSGPQGISARGCLGALGGLTIIAGAIYALIAHGPRFIGAHFPNAEPRIVIFAGCFGLALLWFFLAARRYSKQAAKWPSVRGRIVASAVESFQERSDGRTTTSYRPAVEYAYQAHGREYHGTQIKLGLTVSGSRSYAEKVVAKYRVGAAVDVHYDPANPSTAALENPTGAVWIVAVFALACLALAVWQLGIFKA